MTHRTIAVLDIGSNSGRVVVLRSDANSAPEPLAEARVPLRLVRGLDRDGALDSASIDHALSALADFRAVGLACGADKFIAVATAAVREASNGVAFVSRIQDEIGFEVRVLDGAEEANYAMIGAIHGLDCRSGLVADIGGGSMQIGQFEDRQTTRSWSLPLGALRLSDAFLTSDPPTKNEVESLQQHVQRILAEAEVPTLGSNGVLVGTGGTARNLSRIDRKAMHYPIPRVHGYQLSLSVVRQIAERTASKPMMGRRSIAGLNEDRVDSIVGGAIAFHTLMETVHAPELLVSGQGLREGIASVELDAKMSEPEAMRRGSLQALASRYATWNERAAGRRQAIASAVLAAVDPQPNPEVMEALDGAAHLLDIGRSVDYYRRFAHAADIVCSADLSGFTHRKIALLAAILRFSDGGSVRLKAFSPLLARADKTDIERSCAVLALADHIEARCAPDAPFTVRCARQDGVVRLVVPILEGASVEGVHARFEELTNQRLEVRRS